MNLIERLKGLNLYLVGMMGAGKSSTGAALAQGLGYQFFDTDSVLEAAAAQTIPEIFAQQGEAAFRQLETQVLAELSAYQRLVIATGGGIVSRPENWSYLHHGIVVWLDVPLAVLKQRLAGGHGSAPAAGPGLGSHPGTAAARPPAPLCPGGCTGDGGGWGGYCRDRSPHPEPGGSAHFTGSLIHSLDTLLGTLPKPIT
jgi:shikimate kinase